MDGICGSVCIAVDVGNLIPEDLLDPRYFIQGKKIALPPVVYPVADGNISLGHADFPVQPFRHTFHGVANRHYGDYRTNADNDPQHGQKRTHLVGTDGKKGHPNIFYQHNSCPPQAYSYRNASMGSFLAALEAG